MLNHCTTHWYTWLKEYVDGPLDVVSWKGSFFPSFYRASIDIREKTNLRTFKDNYFRFISIYFYFRNNIHLLLVSFIFYRTSVITVYICT